MYSVYVYVCVRIDVDVKIRTLTSLTRKNDWKATR